MNFWLRGAWVLHVYNDIIIIILENISQHTTAGRSFLKNDQNLVHSIRYLRKIKMLKLPNQIQLLAEAYVVIVRLNLSYFSDKPNLK